MDPGQWIDPALNEAEAYEAWAAMEQASSAEEAEQVYNTYGGAR